MEETVQRRAASRAGMVCTSDWRATQAAVEVLESGGNFIDAAIAAAAVLNVVEPYNSHLGGDAFMLVWSAAEKRVTAVNGSGAAPFGARLEQFAESGIPFRGIRAATVPGQVHAWLTAHRRWGRLDMARLLEPAIRYAEEGFLVRERLARAIADATDCHEQPGFKEQFMPEGKPPAAGQRLRQPNTAEALRLLARKGIEAFYSGPIAEALVKLSRDLGGWFEPQDLRAHHTYLQQPLVMEYGPYTIYEQPAPSQGIIVLECLGLARHLGIDRLDEKDALRVHLMIEALKAAYADRNRWWGDPAFCRLPTQKMLSDEFLAQRAAEINRQAASQYEPADLTLGRDTTYLCVVDSEGNAVSLIQSIFHAFGCGVVEGRFGILLNNRMNGFFLEKRHPNGLYPGKRPVHTLNSWMVHQAGSPVLIGGTPGGPNQVQWNFQALTALLDKQKSLEQVLAAPRWSWVQGLEVQIEPEFGPEIIDDLRTRGHRITVTEPLGLGSRMKIIRVDRASGLLEGAIDPRVAGMASSPGA